MTYPLPTLACTISADGISAPPFDSIYTSLQASFQSIFGTDAYIDPDSQDGQMLAVVARGFADVNDKTIGVYNNFSPAYAQGAGLSAGVKLNGLARRTPSASTAIVTLTGVAGTVITNGRVTDAAETHQWALPASVTIPPAGFIDALATCADVGAVEAAAASLTIIVTPTLGWQSASNVAAATPGNPVEIDAVLRGRQARATQLPGNSTVGALESALSEVTGVSDLTVHENDTDTTDSVGVPEHSVAVIIVGGSEADITSTVALKKGGGCYTFGTLHAWATDPQGLPILVGYSRPIDIPVDIVLNLIPSAGYSDDVEAAQEAALHAYLNSLRIGEPLYFNRLWSPALLAGCDASVAAGSGTFQIVSMTANGGTVNITPTYNQRVVAGTVTIHKV